MTKSVIVTDRSDRVRIRGLTTRIGEAKRELDQLAKLAAPETAEETTAREESRKMKKAGMMTPLPSCAGYSASSLT